MGYGCIFVCGLWCGCVSGLELCMGDSLLAAIQYAWADCAGNHYSGWDYASLLGSSKKGKTTIIVFH